MLAFPFSSLVNFWNLVFGSNFVFLGTECGVTKHVSWGPWCRNLVLKNKREFLPEGGPWFHMEELKGFPVLCMGDCFFQCNLLCFAGVNIRLYSCLVLVHGSWEKQKRKDVYGVVLREVCQVEFAIDRHYLLDLYNPKPSEKMLIKMQLFNIVATVKYPGGLFFY